MVGTENTCKPQNRRSWKCEEEDGPWHWRKKKEKDRKEKKRKGVVNCLEGDVIFNHPIINTPEKSVQKYLSFQSSLSPIQ
jgi:hypothetical protein